MKKLILVLLICSSLSFGMLSYFHGALPFVTIMNKPTEDITWIDRGIVVVSHAYPSDMLGESTYDNWLLLNAMFTGATYYNAKKHGVLSQYQQAYFYGNFLDGIDKLIFGGTVNGVIAAIPVVGEWLVMFVPALLGHEVVHNIPGYPKPVINLTAEQTFALDLSAFIVTNMAINAGLPLKISQDKEGIKLAYKYEIGG
jgi:hypothetical protein